MFLYSILYIFMLLSLHITLLWKYLMKENFNKLHLITHLIWIWEFDVICKKCTNEPYSLLVTEIITSGNRLHPQKNLVKKTFFTANIRSNHMNWWKN